MDSPMCTMWDNRTDRHVGLKHGAVHLEFQGTVLCVPCVTVGHNGHMGFEYVVVHVGFEHGVVHMGFH